MEYVNSLGSNQTPSTEAVSPMTLDSTPVDSSQTPAKDLTREFDSEPLPAPSRPDVCMMPVEAVAASEADSTAANPRQQLLLVDSKKRPKPADGVPSDAHNHEGAKREKTSPDAVGDSADRKKSDLGAVDGALPIPEGMPEHALPQGYRKGRLSYTISSPTSKARVEVLLKQRAFRIVKIGEKDGYWDH
ncbi:unnamed protein product [Cladocopium goreaui]|uniref:Uncharacterized protein n=1 Tax=Cladocopium goreaui TaxID=2562237 RepID=A0A9P1BMH8_9DINO|nr:unnamed protein product [Cladocopium goreaui]